MSFNPDKMEIMICSNMEIPNNLTFSFNGKLISNTSNHTHLGVTLSHDAKWGEHVENIAKTISKHLGVLRKFKFKMNRQNLEQMYLVYIRPISEYVCEAWDNCGTCHSNKLEKIQLEAARIVTGLPNLQKLILYISKLAGNHYILGVTRKHRLFYKIYNGFEPQYLHDLISLTIQSTTIYSLRNGNDLIVSFCRLSSTNSSFIPSSVREWNKLENTVRNLDIPLKFKRAQGRIQDFKLGGRT
jgi:hypothetical protein